MFAQNDLIGKYYITVLIRRGLMEAKRDDKYRLPKLSRHSDMRSVKCKNVEFI